MSVRPGIGRVRGEGVRVRHSRTCRAGTGPADCPCGPSFEAWVYDAGRGRKRRRTFSSYCEAKQWRLDSLRRMYADVDRAAPKGRPDEAYSLLRRAAQQLDRSIAEAAPPRRAHLRAALEAVYEAEVDLLRGLTA